MKLTPLCISLIQAREKRGAKNITDPPETLVPVLRAGGFDPRGLASQRLHDMTVTRQSIFDHLRII
ncbi:hypothetical protein [Streptomyces roseus]|uniref:hypothetical protein n=1 Tax=Streptomyces roseus TaxID=66430 RepID=UPI000AA8BFAF|nr:hypothetical protein [Streptomyces roseus]